MRVLSIDPALRKTGYAVIERAVEANRRISYRALTYGVIENRRDLRQSSCLVAIREKLVEVIREFGPEVCAVEGIIFVQSYRTAITMGAARGAGLMAAAEHGLEVERLSAQEVDRRFPGSRSRVIAKARNSA